MIDELRIRNRIFLSFLFHICHSFINILLLLLLRRTISISSAPASNCVNRIVCRSTCRPGFTHCIAFCPFAFADGRFQFSSLLCITCVILSISVFLVFVTLFLIRFVKLGGGRIVIAFEFALPPRRTLS
jgi:hypothetical protein